jgi:hypothetical protein
MNAYGGVKCGSTHSLSISAIDGVVSQLHAPPAILPGTNSECLLDMNLRSDLMLWKVEKFLLLPGIEPQFSGHTACTVVTILTEHVVNIPFKRVICNFSYSTELDAKLLQMCVCY